MPAQARDCCIEVKRHCFSGQSLHVWVLFAKTPRTACTLVRQRAMPMVPYFLSAGHFGTMKHADCIKVSGR